MRSLAIFLLILFAAQLPEKPVAAQTSQAELQRLIQRAQAGDAEAQVQLGYKYQKGIGVAQSGSEAVKWYRLAAEQGYVIAQSNLGVIYAGGRGVAKDLSEAYVWFTIAKALRQIERLEPQMTGRQIAQAKQRVAKWLKAHPKD